MELNTLLFESALFSSIILGLLSIIFLSRLNGYKKYIGYYAILVAVFETIAYVLVFHFKMKNLQGLHLYTLLEFIIISSFFYFLYKKLDFKIPIKNILLVGSFLIISNSLFLQSFSKFPSNSRIGVELFIISFCIFFYTLLLRNLKEKETYKSATIFVSAILIKSSLSSVLYLFSNSIMRMEPTLRDQLWCFRAIVNLIAIVMIFAAIIIIIQKSFTKEKLASSYNDA